MYRILWRVVCVVTVKSWIIHRIFCVTDILCLILDGYYWHMNVMDELLLTGVGYALLFLLLVTNFFFFLVAPKGAVCFSGCPGYRGLWGVRSSGIMSSFIAWACRSDEEACCNRCRNRTICCFDYPHC